MPEVAVMPTRDECPTLMSNAEVARKTAPPEVCDVSTEVPATTAEVPAAEVPATEVSTDAVSSAIVSGGRTGRH